MYDDEAIAAALRGAAASRLYSLISLSERATVIA
jgi:hypothetical protein